MSYTKIESLPRELLKTVRLSVVLAFSSMLFIGASADPPGQFSDAWMDQSFDWVLKIDPMMLPNYALYEGSTLKPVIDLRTSIRLNPGLSKGQSQQYTPYEDLWYGNGKAIGCRRSIALPLQSGLRGAIYIPLSELASKQPDAFAHAITRLTLDVGLKSCSVVSVIAPESAINPIADSLKRFGFLRSQTIPTEPSPDSLMLLLTPGTDSETTTMLERPPSTQ